MTPQHAIIIAALQVLIDERVRVAIPIATARRIISDGGSQKGWEYLSEVIDADYTYRDATSEVLFTSRVTDPAPTTDPIPPL